MKQFYFLLITIFVASGIQAQIINFPDADFKAKLLSSTNTNFVAQDGDNNSIIIDANENGEIEVSEAVSVKRLNVSSSSIADVTGISGFVNLEDLSCYENQLTSLDLLALPNLKYVSCAGNNISNLNVSGLSNLQSIVATYNNLTSINLSGLANLKHLDLDNNHLSAIDLTGLSALEHFRCRYNSFTTISFNNLNSLNTIYCSANQINSLTINNLPALTFLDCNYNQLSSLAISASSPIHNLNCTHNQFVNLDVSNLSYLLSLDCSSNAMSSLILPPSIQSLTCGDNQFTALNLPGINLAYLYCAHNAITYLDLSAMTNLVDLDCSNNPISSLNLNNSIYFDTLYCNETLITSLDLSQCHYFTGGTINNNQLLTMLNFKNGQNMDVANITFSGNPNLAYICADEGEVAGVQTMITQNGYNCNINSYCSFVPGGEFFTIEGNAKYDQNADGCGATDMVVPNFKINITDGTISGIVISNESGNYTIPVQEGTHTMAPIFENPSYFTVSPAIVNVSFPTEPSPVAQNFCVAANGVHNDLEIALIPISMARPGFDATYKIIYKNKGTGVQSGSVNLTFNDAVSDLMSAVPLVSTQATNSLSWDFINLQPFETRSITLTLNLNSPTETPALNGGDNLDYSASVNSFATEATPADNNFGLHQTVVNAYDPNDKTCLEGNTISPDMVGQYVHYMIRFENTGSANAQNIVVKDIIDTTKFDINTLIPLSGSAPFTTRITNTNKAEFIFENINLPFDDANNDGYVAFKIKTKPTLVVGDTFTNNASIYFDYNFPIVTNTASTTIQLLGTPDFDFADHFTLYPNPAKNTLNIHAKDAVVHSINIYNILGQLVLAIPNAENLSSIDVSDLKPGNYFIKINSDKGNASSKFIKQ